MTKKKKKRALLESSAAEVANVCFSIPEVLFTNEGTARILQCFSGHETLPTVSYRVELPLEVPLR